jgi:uncharacterized protein
LSCEAGLFTHDKPSYACLATRVPTGRVITEELLTKICDAEQALRSLGFTDFRIRLVDEYANIQLPKISLNLSLIAVKKYLRHFRPILKKSYWILSRA